MSYLEDLADSRRGGKTWLPADDRDVTNGLVVADSIRWDGRPVCLLHGAMNRVDAGEQIYRCSTCGVGARWWGTNTPEAKRRFSRAFDARYEAGRKR